MSDGGSRRKISASPVPVIFEFLHVLKRDVNLVFQAHVARAPVGRSPSESLDLRSTLWLEEAPVTTVTPARRWSDDIIGMMRRVQPDEC